jgi:hypothetical protein
MPKITVFARAYRPLTVDGKTYFLIKTKVEAKGPYEIGNGFEGYIITNGKIKFIAEATTGAAIGGTLKEVREDIKNGDMKLMKEQIKEAKKNLKEAKSVSTKKFWEDWKESL